jgi:hypothetical protein
MLRRRCDVRGFKSLPIEIIARQKVAPAFEPQKLSWVDGPPKLLAKIGQKRVARLDPRALKENSAGFFGRAGDLPACGPPMRLIVTITCADEVRRAKSNFRDRSFCEFFHTIDVNRSFWIAMLERCSRGKRPSKHGINKRLLG